jgi:hypothetical protein
MSYLFFSSLLFSSLLFSSIAALYETLKEQPTLKPQINSAPPTPVRFAPNRPQLHNYLLSISGLLPQIGILHYENFFFDSWIDNYATTNHPYGAYLSRPLLIPKTEKQTTFFVLYTA